MASEDEPKLLPFQPAEVALPGVGGAPISTRARSDDELVASWLANFGSKISRAKFKTTARRFRELLARRGLVIRMAKVEDVREAIAELTEGKAPSTAVQYAQRVKSLLSYAHRLGYLPFNAGVAVRTHGGQVDRAKRIASETEIALLIRAAPTTRDRLMIEVGYAGGLRVSELVGLQWFDAILRDGDRVQLSVPGPLTSHARLPRAFAESFEHGGRLAAAHQAERAAT